MVGNLRTGAAMTAYMDHKDLANEVIDQARAQEITDGVHRVLDRIASAESAAGVLPVRSNCWLPPRRAMSARFWRLSMLVFA